MLLIILFGLLQVEIHLEEIQNEGLVVSWMFQDRPDLNLSVLPRFQSREVSKLRMGWIEMGRMGVAGTQYQL